MRVVIAGAGNVGQSIAAELVASGHRVLLIERDPAVGAEGTVPGAQWLTSDACEVSTMEEVVLDDYDVAIAATGDDKANLVFSLLAKTEFSVPRTVARVNHPRNEWLFTDQWGVDVAVSTPRVMSALVEEAVTVGALVRLHSFRQGPAELVELTLGEDSPQIGVRLGELRLPGEAVLVAMIREDTVRAPDPQDVFRSGDELLFVTTSDCEQALNALLGAPEQEAGD